MNFSTITNDLFIGTTPSAVDYNQLRDLGVRLIINMRFRRGPAPDLHVPPIDLLWLRTIDSPFFPIPIDKLMRGARRCARYYSQWRQSVFSLRRRGSSRCGNGSGHPDRARP